MAASAEPKKLTAHDLKAAVRARYEPPEWHVEAEVELGGRRLDLVALNLWGARAYRIVGFELKVSRGDWLRELDAFQKSEDWAAVVDSFYVVTPPKLVRDDELPAGWGLLELTGSRMMTRRHAAVRDGAFTIPREVAARFIGRLVQSLANTERQAEFKARDEIRQEERKRIEDGVTRELSEARGELLKMDREYGEIITTLGVDRLAWRKHENAMRAAGVFANAQDGKRGLRERLHRQAAELEGHAEHLRAAITTLDDAASAPSLLEQEGIHD